MSRRYLSFFVFDSSKKSLYFMGKISSTSNGLVSTFIAPFGKKEKKKAKMYLKNFIFLSFFLAFGLNKLHFYALK